jgi:hypothetical protein
MVRRWGMAAAMTVAVVCAVTGSAAADVSTNPSYLLFAGSDLWRAGAFLYGGFLWVPGGLDGDRQAPGFTLKLLLSGGDYSYPSSSLHTVVDGRLVSATALPGWRLTRDALTLSVYAGPLLQDYRLTPYDPGSRLHGLYAGAQFATDIWYQPNPATMVAVNGTLLSVGPTGSLRAAFGERFPVLPAFIGPEAQALWCAEYQELRVGAHVTGWRFEALEWEAGGGFAADSDRRTGPYLHLGFNSRF